MMGNVGLHLVLRKIVLGRAALTAASVIASKKGAIGDGDGSTSSLQAVTRFRRPLTLTLHRLFYYLC